MFTEPQTSNLERANLIRVNLREADLTDFLCRVPLFSGLDRITRAKLAAHLEPVAVLRGRRLSMRATPEMRSTWPWRARLRSRRRRPVARR